MPRAAHCLNPLMMVDVSSRSDPPRKCCLSIVIPAYNEEARLGRVLEDYLVFFEQQEAFEWEIVVALNGCNDGTELVVASFHERDSRIRMIVNPEPIGKGGAILEGIDVASSKDLIGFVDADGATDAKSFYTIAQAAQGCDLACGSRWLPESDVVRAQGLGRRFLSRLFNWWVNAFFFLGVRDTQCGAKVFQAGLLKDIRPKLVIADMAFDVNLLFLVKKSGGSICEVPIRWEDQLGSKVHLIRTSLSMALSIIRLRWIYSPLAFLRPCFRPLEMWIYNRLHR